MISDNEPFPQLDLKSHTDAATMAQVDPMEYSMRKNKSFRSASITVTDDDDDIVFMAQPTTRGPIRETDSISENVPKGRFVAGEAFFNYAAFGSLREGLPSVMLLSPQYIGLAFNAMLAGFTVTFSTYALQPLLVAVLTEYQPDQIDAAAKLVQWPNSLAVFTGLFSDCVPLFGYRRKSYMMLGWIISAVMFFGMSLIDSTMVKTTHSIGYLYLITSIGAGVGNQIMWIASLAMTVEFAQREHLYERGHLQSLFFVLHFGAATITSMVCAFIIHPQDDGSLTADVTLSSVSLILGVACILPLPLLYWFLLEEYAPTNRVSITSRITELWNFLQQKVVYCIFFYIVVTIFLLGASSPDVQNAVFAWAGYTPSKSMWLSFSIESPKLIGVLLYKAFFINVDWRKIGASGFVLFLGSSLAFMLPVTYGHMRHLWYMYLMMVISQIPQGFFELFIVIPPTEIADIGREGVTMGLITSFVQLITIAGGTLWESLNKAASTKISVEEVMADDHEVHHTVAVSTAVYSAIQFLSVLMFWFLPKQKLDAQQLRAFGGYNSMARLAILAVFVALLVYDLGSSLANW